MTIRKIKIKAIDWSSNLDNSQVEVKLNQCNAEATEWSVTVFDTDDTGMVKYFDNLEDADNQFEILRCIGIVDKEALRIQYFEDF
jgi:hypothetical protein